MSSPSSAEIATLKMWSVYTHCNIHISRYIMEGRILYKFGCTVIKVAQQNQQGLASQQTLPAQGASMTQAELAEGLKIRLELDQDWNRFLSNKSSMTTKVHAIITDIVARYIAWDYYQAIIR